MAGFLGIDVAKATLDVSLKLHQTSHYAQFSNDAEGHTCLLQWVHMHTDSPPHVALEATGGYGLPVASFLHQHHFPVSILEPRQLKGFAISIKQRNKTDKQDAQLLALFCSMHHPTLWEPTDQTLQHLRERTRYLHCLKDDRQRLLNRRDAFSTDTPVQQSLTRRIQQLDTEIQSIQHNIQQLFEDHQLLMQQQELLTSIKGIAQHTASILIAEIGNIHAFDSARQLAAYAGITPISFQSGSSVKRPDRISKQGNSHLRHALYFPAMTAMRWNPHCQALAQRMREKGKPGKVILIAVAHKLLRIAYGVLRSQQPYDPHYLAETA